MSNGPSPPAGRRSAPPSRFWRYAQALMAPILLWGLVAFLLWEPVHDWIEGEDGYDRDALTEWLDESRGSATDTLPEMAAAYAQVRGEQRRLPPPPADTTAFDPQLDKRGQVDAAVAKASEDLHSLLRALGDPPTKIYTGQLPLFPTIYRIEIRFDDASDEPIVWDSQLPFRVQEVQVLNHPLPSAPATARVYYQLHAFNIRQRLEQEHQQRLQQLSILAVIATLLVAVWIVLVRRREGQRLLVQQQVDVAERKFLEEGRRRAETERQLLEQRLATQAAEQKALELKSQLYASIGIMAGSYAHNIKNLLVRPNDLLRRCMEADSLSGDQQGMLREVQQTLGTVTERLQQILRTVRRDPSKTEQTVLDLNALLRDLERTWRDLARDRYKLDVALELGEDGAPLWIAGDYSHLQQAVENLLFNARDATFEMRNHWRDAARRDETLDAAARRQALIAAAAWKGRVVLRTRRERDAVVLEVQDNGAGMTEEVRRRCLETHFTTKRDNAIYEGHSTGMGLGLSFVAAILEHHGAKLEIESAPLKGATFQARFPGAASPA
ncbi:MAG TPA: HAMP domain-containing sensor histidine kinase [Gemmataceae bacterium]|nr:HAMP domain-containing sensor histidine kinase [Gemmataceae bacterium]